MTEARQKLGVLCSGRGTDLQSIMDAINNGEVAADIAVVLTDKPDAFALERAARTSAFAAESSSLSTRSRSAASSMWAKSACSVARPVTESVRMALALARFSNPRATMAGKKGSRGRASRAFTPCSINTPSK